MDSLTHIVLGACVGEVMAGKKLGKKAMVWGALLNSLPDVDFLASFFLSPTKDLIIHRGFTHSIFFLCIIAPLLAAGAYRWHRSSGMRYKDFLLFFGVEIFLHIFLDTFNVYGTGWWEPFSAVRWSWDFMFVADPLFTITLLAGAIFLWVMPLQYPRRRKFAVAVLTFCILYIGWSGINKYRVDQWVKASADRQGITFQRYFSTPTALNNSLFYCLLEVPGGFYITYRSVYDAPAEQEFAFYARNEELEALVKDVEALNDLKRFSQGWYTMREDSIGISLQDLRFGQILGWYRQPADFIFYYYIDETAANTLVVQRGRFQGWNADTFKYFLKRIIGKHQP